MVKAITNHVYPATPTLDKNGSMVIAMDNFLYVDMSQYKDDVVVKMLRLRPAFKRDAWDDQRHILNLDHSCVEATTTNIMDWTREIKQDIFGKQFRLRMDDAFNENLRQLMNPGNNRDGTEKKVLDSE